MATSGGLPRRRAAKDNIIDRKREEALRKSEERFQRYFELGLIGMAITSADERHA